MTVDERARQKLVEELVANWPAPVVARRDAERFSGGLVRPGTLANCDSRGIGPKGRIQIGKNAGYYSRPLAEWIAELMRSASK